jgi:hypothetical protein
MTDDNDNVIKLRNRRTNAEYLTTLQRRNELINQLLDALATELHYDDEEILHTLLWAVAAYALNNQASSLWLFRHLADNIEGLTSGGEYDSDFVRWFKAQLPRQLQDRENKFAYYPQRKKP